MQQERVLIRRFGLLTALGFLPLGLLVPTYVLLLTARGFGPTAIGALIAATAVVTLLLELPTGGLADVVGRRVVLIASSLVMAAGFVLFAIGSTHWAIVVGLVLYASGRALSSGPLTSWFVDEVHAVISPERHDDVLTRGLAHSSTATGIALAAGSISGGWLASLGVHFGLASDGDGLLIGLSVPALLAAVLFVVHAALLLVLMDELRRPRTSVRDLVASVPGTVKEGVLLVVQRPVLRWFSLRWTVVPVGFLAFELISPVRLGELLDRPGQAAGVFGVVVAVAYIGQSVSALAAPRLVHRVGRLRASAVLTVLTGLAFALAGHGGTVWLVVAVLLAMTISGPVNALNGPIVHAAVSASHRATLLSVESLATQIAVAGGAVLLGAIVHSAGTVAAFTVAGLFTVAGAIPLLGVWRNLPADDAKVRPPFT